MVFYTSIHASSHVDPAQLSVGFDTRFISLSISALGMES